MEVIKEDGFEKKKGRYLVKAIQSWSVIHWFSMNRCFGEEILIELEALCHKL